MAFLVDKAFLVATQECFENAIATGILRLGSTHPDLDKFSGSAFLEKKKLWFRTNKGLCVRFSPKATCMTSALVRSNVEVPMWLLEQLHEICQSSIQITLQFQKACIREEIFQTTEVDESSLEILDDLQLSLERGIGAGIAFNAGAEAAEKSIAAERILKDPTWNQTLEATTAPGNGLVTKQGELSGNSNAQGFAAEHQVINRFNAQASSTDSPYRAISTESYGGSTSEDAPDIQIIDLRTGDVVDEIQVKSGSHEYVSSSISDDRYEDMNKLHNLEAGSVEGSSTIYTSPDKQVQVSFTQEEANQIAQNPRSYVDDQRSQVEDEAIDQKIASVEQTLSIGTMGGGGISAANGFAECMGAIAKGDSSRAEVILRSIPERTIDGALRGLGRAGWIAATQAVIGANPVTTSIGIVGVDMVRSFGAVLSGEQTAAEAFKDVTPRTLGTMATITICMANPAMLVGIVGYRFAYGFIRSYTSDQTSDSTLKLNNVS